MPYPAHITGRRWALGLALLFLALSATPAFAETITVAVVRVLDGDTIEVENGAKLRLFGLDAPEISHNSKEVTQPYGLEAQNKLSDLAYGKVLRCRVETVDMYGRQVVSCRDGLVDINRAMVSSGLALAYRTYSLRYENEERLAACSGLGMWAITPLPPWHWRHCKGEKK